MKLFISPLITAVLLTALSSQVWAQNVNSIPVEFGKYNQLTTLGTNLDNKKVISLEVRIDSQEAPPIVEISTRSHGSCFHKQTLISLSGYDYKKQSSVHIYEIQIERDPEKTCALLIFTNNSQSLEQAARVSIL